MAMVDPQQLNTQFRGMSALPAARQAGLLVGLAASVAIGVAVVLWAREPSMSVLFAGLADRDAAAVMQALDQAAIEYRVDQRTGTVMVPAREVHDARIRLATQGLPRATGTGFELLEGDQGMGTSRLIETARYHRAIEGELARSIMSLASVQSARVHLAIPKNSVFIRNRTKPSASVLVDLYSGRSLSEEQVAGIVHLVASSVPDLETEQVTVVDQNGRLLTAGGPDAGDGMGLRADRLKYAQRVEQTYVQRIMEILTPILGPDGVRAQVAADIDFSVVETTSEVYTPDPESVRSEQIDEDQRRSESLGGVPGALTNQPPAGGVIAQGEGVLADAATPQPLSSSRRVTRNYELDRTISHTRVAPGSIRRLSVAVVVNDRIVDDTPTPLTEQELERVNALVREAVGFDAERGDSVNVSNVSFQTVEAERIAPAPGVPFWKEPFLWDALKHLFGALGVLFLIFFVLRPVLKTLAERGKEPAPSEAAFPPGMMQGALPGGQMPPAMAAQGGAAALAGPGMGMPGSYEDQVGAARKMVNDDPKRVAQVVKTWVGGDE